MTKICILSDTHGSHEQIKVPKADLVIYCGDYTARHSAEELPNFATWLNSLKVPVLLVPGNHDWVFDTNRLLAVEETKLYAPNVTVLIGQAVELFGMKFYGDPRQPPFCSWAFNVPDDKRGIYWDQIPEDTEILVTHCPPYGILDKVVSQGYYYDNNHINVEYVGDKILAERIRHLPKLKLHCFGHLHDGGWRGVGKKKPKKVTKSGRIYINGSVLNDQYNIESAYKPIVVEITNNAHSF